MPDDVAALKAMVLASRAKWRNRDLLIEKLKHQLASSHRQRFHATSETPDHLSALPSVPDLRPRGDRLGPLDPGRLRRQGSRAFGAPSRRHRTPCVGRARLLHRRHPDQAARTGDRQDGDGPRPDLRPRRRALDARSVAGGLAPLLTRPERRAPARRTGARPTVETVLVLPQPNVLGTHTRDRRQT